MDVTLTTMLADVRREGSIPNSGGTGSQDSDLIAFLNKNLIGIASEVIKCREGFYRRYKDYTLSGTRYRIPTRAIGNRLVAVLLLDGNGKVLRKLDEVAYGADSNFQNITDTMGYHLEAGDVVLTPAAPTGSVATVRLVYYCRPGFLSSSLDTASGDCFSVTTVTVVSTTSVQLTIASSHGLTTSSKVDVMKGGPPGEYLTVDNTPTATGSTTVTLTVDDSSKFEVGDYVCKADKAPIAQIPDAFYPPLVLMAALEFWRSLNDSANVKRLEEAIWGDSKRNIGEMGRAIALIAPRVEEGAKKISSPYGVMGALRGPTRRVY